MQIELSRQFHLAPNNFPLIVVSKPYLLSLEMSHLAHLTSWKNFNHFSSTMSVYTKQVLCRLREIERLLKLVLWAIIDCQEKSLAPCVNSQNGA